MNRKQDEPSMAGPGDRLGGTSEQQKCVSHPGFLGENTQVGRLSAGQVCVLTATLSQTRRASASGYRTPQPGMPSS